jgi:TonB-linked SusC/RagA family outer membrane protein
MKKLTLVLMLVFFGVSTMLAQRTISGKITDDKGEALIGASLLVQGTGTGTVTDFDGNYTLSVPAGGSVLVVSYTGFTTEEFTLGASDVLDITLKEGALLEEIIVTAVGLESNKRQIGYSVQNVKPDDLVSSKETNLLNALSGKVAGVSVTSSSGSPGSSSSVRIRGNVSIGRSNSPLFVVDGVPIDNSESGNGTGGVDQSNRAIDINPNDIASMTVLKGPSATALYGVRAANGAIVITTKSGKEGKPVVNVTARYSMDQINKVPDAQNEYAQGRSVGGVPTWRGPHTAEGFSWGPAIADLEFDGSEYDYDLNGRLVAKGTGNGVPAKAYDIYDFFKNGNTYDLNASVSGGSDVMRYFISAGTLESRGIVPNATFKRTSFRVKVDADLTDKLKASMSANYVNSGGDRIQRGSNIRGVMLGLLRNTPTFDMGNGKIGQEAADDPDTYVLANGSQRSYRAGVYDNPYWTANKNPSKDNVNRIIGYTSLSYEFTDWLTLSYKVGIDHYTDRRNSALDINPGRSAGTVNQDFYSNRDINSDLLLTLRKDISETLGFSATIGGNSFSTDFFSHGTEGTTLSAPNFYHISNATDLTAYEGVGRKKLYGVYGTFDFNYSDYLFLNLTARNDWSSSLPVDNNTFQSYSASLGFALTEAIKMQANPILSYAKLRASYGVVGNDAPIYATSNYFGGAFSGGDGFISGISFPAYGTNAFERNTGLGNDKIVPETTTTWEVGGEFKFLKGRLGIDVTYFDSESVDQIVGVQLPATTGFTSVVQNAGKISNKGWEIIGDVGVVNTNNFNWDIQVNFTKIENLVEELAEGIDKIALAGFTSTQSVVQPGEAYGAIWGDGFQRTDEGTLIIGENGWPLASPDKIILGDPNPDWTMGVRNTFNFKGLRLSALFDFRQGGDMWCGTCGVMGYFGKTQQSADERDDVVVFDGVVNTGTAESPVYTDNNTPVALADPAQGIGSYYRVRYGFGYSEMNIFDTSWIRLRELTLGYSLPKSLLSGTFIGGIDMTLTGRNLWLSTDYPGVDPETNLTGSSNGFGLDYFNMPNTKSFSATVKLTF